MQHRPIHCQRFPKVWEQGVLGSRVLAPFRVSIKLGLLHFTYHGSIVMSRPSHHRDETDV